MLELLTTGGVELPRALRMLIPPAWQNIEGIDPDLKAFYQYNAMHMEPWDGPAGSCLDPRCGIPSLLGGGVSSGQSLGTVMKAIRNAAAEHARGGAGDHR